MIQPGTDIGPDLRASEIRLLRLKAREIWLWSFIPISNDENLLRTRLLDFQTFRAST